MSRTSTTPIVEGLRLLRRVGSGGEGEVWEARDAAGRAKAFKLIRPESLADAEQVALRAQQLRRIEHPALVRVHRSGIMREGRLAGWGYVEMDFVDGTPLDAAPPDPHALARLAPLAEALDWLHAGQWSDGQPLVHRDVKPGNLIETADGDVVLVDPSTLRGLDSGAVTRVGTPLFCAPEVLRGKVTPAADVYSFAATLVALASGARGEELAELLEDPSALGLPSGVARALAHRPSDRPRSCRAVLSAAEELTHVFPDSGGWLAEVDHEDDEPVPGDAPPVHDRSATRRLAAKSARHERAAWPETWPDSALPWALALLALLVVPAATWGGGRPDALPLVVAVAALLHVVLVRMGGFPIWLAVVAPPLAWADLLASRAVPPSRRRVWAATMLLGGVSAALTPLLSRLAGGGASGLAVAMSTLAGGLVVLGIAQLPRMRGAEAALLRLLALPVWAVGVALLWAFCLLALPVALFSGHAQFLLRRMGRSLAAGVETFLPPR